MSGLFDLSGQVALVTGASGGLGRRFARTLAGGGAAVALTARRAGALHDLTQEITAAGGRAAAVAMDVAQAASVRDGFDAAEAALGPVGLLINNAGIAVTRPALEQTEAEWDRVLDTNLKGVWLVAREAGRRMAERETGGSIVNIASILGARPASQVAGYAASKAGLVQLTRVLALELARHNIRVNALAPGYIETDLNRAFFASAAGQRLIRRFPLGRLGDPEDLDGALLLLASDAGRYITGAVLTVDGGQSLAV